MFDNGSAQVLYPLNSKMYFEKCPFASSLNITLTVIPQVSWLSLLQLLKNMEGSALFMMIPLVKPSELCFSLMAKEVVTTAMETYGTEFILKKCTDCNSL